MSRRGHTSTALAALVLAVVAGLVGPSGAAPAEAAGVARVVSAPTATGSISGTVTVPTGVDATEVTVYAWPLPRTSSNYAWARVRADGTYEIEGLAAGRYRVEFQGWAAGLIHGYWDGTPYADAASAVDVGSAAVTGIDATLASGATVSGTIHTNSDCDLTGVYVGLMGAPGQVIPDATVQPDGSWSIRGIPTGDYQIVFDGRYVSLPRSYWNGLGSPEGESTLHVTAGATATGIDATLNGPTTGCLSIRPYVVQVYEDLLGRHPDAGGLNTWVNQLVWGSPLRSVANAITASDEFRSRLLDATYRTYLGRAPDRSGLAFWLGQMRTGHPIEGVQAGFIASDEFYASFGGTPRGWVVGLYQTVLDRNPSTTEVDWWVSKIAAGMDRGSVAAGFLYSTEHLTTVVDGYYVDLLARHIDPVGRAYWVAMIQQGHRDEEIVAGIVSSAEYVANVGR